MKAERRNISTTPALWALVQKAAAKAGVEAGKPVSTSAWLRRAILDRLAKEGVSYVEENP